MARRSDRTQLRLADLGIGHSCHTEVEDSLARGGFSMFGEGHHGGVYESARHPGLVVRYGNCVDGFGAYCLLSRGTLRPFVGIHVPVVHDLAVTGDCMVALCERLSPPVDDDRVVEAARAAMGGMPRGGDTPDFGELDGRHPHFRSFLHVLGSLTGRRSFDRRDGNLLMRGGNLILNDPMGHVLRVSEAEDLRARLPLRGLGRVPSPAPAPDVPVLLAP